MKLLFENWRNYMNEQEEPTRDLEGQTIVLIGDSQTVGAMGRNLEKMLKGRGAKVVRLARGASSTKFWNRTLDGKRHYLHDKKPKTRKYTLDFIKKHNPTQIIVNLGGNTAGNSQKYYDDSAIPLMQKLKSITPNVTWFGPGQNYRSIQTRGSLRWWCRKKGYSIEQCRIKSKQNRESTDQILNDIAQQTGVKYVSMLEWTKQHEMLKDKVQEIEDLRLAGRIKEAHRLAKEIRHDGIHYGGKPAQYYAETIALEIGTQEIKTTAEPEPVIEPEPEPVPEPTIEPEPEPTPVQIPEPEPEPVPEPTIEPAPTPTPPKPRKKSGTFVHGYKRKQFPNFDFDNFYKELDTHFVDQGGALGMLPKYKKDYKFGREHRAAFKKLQQRIAKEPAITPSPSAKKPSEVKVTLSGTPEPILNILDIIKTQEEMVFEPTDLHAAGYKEPGEEMMPYPPEEVLRIRKMMDISPEEIKEGIENNAFLNELEPIQQKWKEKHSRMKKKLIGGGGNEEEQVPYDSKPSYKRAKSAPPGAGGV